MTSPGLGQSKVSNEPSISIPHGLTTGFILVVLLQSLDILSVVDWIVRRVDQTLLSAMAAPWRESLI